MNNLKKHSIAFLSLLFVVVAMLCFSTSCKKSSEKAGEKMIEKAIGDNADVDMDKEKITIETDEGKFVTDASANSWPKEIPGDVPELEGKIINVSTMDMKDGKNWTMMYEELDDDVLEAYKKELKGADYEVHATIVGGEGGRLMATKGEMMVSFTTGKGKGVLAVSLNK